MTQGCALSQSLGAEAWLGHLPDLDVGEADSYLLLDQYPPCGPGARADPQLLMMPNLIVGPRDGEADCDNGGGSGFGSGSQSGSPAAQQARKLQGGTNRGRQPSRTTSLAQREAHKRYREKKKQSVSEENSVSCKSLHGSVPKFAAVAFLSTCTPRVEHSFHTQHPVHVLQLVPRQSTAQCYAGCLLPLTAMRRHCRCCCCHLPRQIAAMEAAVQAKRSQLEQLQAENDQLRSKARVLETAERCSVEIHELMKLLDGLQVGWRLAAAVCSQGGGAVPEPEVVQQETVAAQLCACCTQKSLY